MKLILKIAVLVLLTKLMVSPPDGARPQVDAVKKITVGDMAYQFDALLTRAGKAIQAIR